MNEFLFPLILHLTAQFFLFLNLEKNHDVSEWLIAVLILVVPSIKACIPNTEYYLNYYCHPETGNLATKDMTNMFYLVPIYTASQLQFTFTFEGT